MSPEVVREAIRRGLIDPGEADRFLRDWAPPRPLALIPKTLPPPERLALVRRPDGRVYRARQRFTKALLAAGVLDADVIRARRPTTHKETRMNRPLPDLATLRMSRPLPTDLATLRTHWLPPEPDDTTVTRMRNAAARIDQAVAATVADLGELDDHDRQLVADLVDAAVASGPLEPIVARLTPGDRTQLEHRLAQLRAASASANYRLAHAQRTDPVHVAWVAECRRITDEWNIANYDDTDRLGAFVAFAQRLGIDVAPVAS